MQQAVGLAEWMAPDGFRRWSATKYKGRAGLPVRLEEMQSLMFAGSVAVDPL